jgi:integrase
MSKRIPSYRRHAATGQAVVTLCGRDVYLGKHGTPESREAYERAIAEWLTGRRLGKAADGRQAAITIVELIRDYMRFAETYYRKNSKPTSEVANCRYAFTSLRALYGRTLAREFSPRCLKLVREKILAGGVCRKTANDRVLRIKRLFKWGVENELVPAEVFHALQCVPGLKRGRCEAREPDPVGPADEDAVQAVLKHVSPQVCTMIQLQLITGMRPGEVVLIRMRDIDRSGPVWTYRPESHKTEHHGVSREIPLGPKAQALVRPWLLADSEAYLFSAAAAIDARRQRQRAARKTRVQPSQENRRKQNPAWRPRSQYDVASYRRAIAQGCDKAGVPRWSPNQLRHTCATRLRREYGIEAARIILGHRSALVTEIYAEIDRTKAARIMAEVG